MFNYCILYDLKLKIEHIIFVMSKILIHGSSSWLGKSTLDHLISKHYSYDNFILTSNKFTHLFHKEKKYKLYNSSELKNIKNEDIDILYFYSFPINKIQNEALLKKDFTKLMNELELLITQNRIKKIFLASSGSVYGVDTDKYSIYSKYKKTQEVSLMKICEEHKIELQICRIFAVIAPFYDLSANYAFTTFIKSALEHKFIEVRNPNIMRSFASFNDIVDISLQKLDVEIYDASTSNMTIANLANLVGQYFNVDVMVNQENSPTAFDYLSKDDFIKNYLKNRNLDINLEIISKAINKTIENKLYLKK